MDDKAKEKLEAYAEEWFKALLDGIDRMNREERIAFAESLYARAGVEVPEEVYALA